MMKLHQVVSTFPTIHEKSKERGAMLKLAITDIKNLHEWTTQYLDAPEILLRKDLTIAKDIKVVVRIKVHSHDKLTKDVDKVLASYKHLLSGLESLIQVHKVPSIGSLGEVRSQEEIQAFPSPFKQVVTMEDL